MTFEMRLRGGEKSGIGGPNSEEVAGAQLCVWERSEYLEGGELAFVAEAQVGDDLGKGEVGDDLGKGLVCKGPLYCTLSIK